MPAVLASRTTFFALCLIPEAIAANSRVSPLPQSRGHNISWICVGCFSIPGNMVITCGNIAECF
ncbi:hypothetical protein [Nostoc sp. CALU 1950]|uniref:hypothetical protein n=1 Tax=Nostoc sp. CALU 1950 TaxID=3104321 RepID=UPI003EB78746